MSRRGCGSAQAAADSVKGLRDRLAAEGIAANQILPEVLLQFREGSDNRPFTNHVVRACERFFSQRDYYALYHALSCGVHVQLVKMSAPTTSAPVRVNRSACFAVTTHVNQVIANRI
jgi:hypothetical protein